MLVLCFNERLRPSIYVDAAHIIYVPVEKTYVSRVQATVRLKWGRGGALGERPRLVPKKAGAYQRSRPQYYEACHADLVAAMYQALL